MNSAGLLLMNLDVSSDEARLSPVDQDVTMKVLSITHLIPMLPCQLLQPPTHGPFIFEQTSAPQCIEITPFYLTYKLW